MKDKTYFGSATVELQEAMVEERPLCRRSSKMYYGGPRSSRMQRHMIDLTTFFREWESHHEENNCLFRQFDIYKHLRNGWVTSLGGSTPQLSIQRPSILLPQLITLHVMLRQQLSKISRPILLPGLFLKVLSLGLDVLGV
jgi:hypothetical protein